MTNQDLSKELHKFRLKSAAPDAHLSISFADGSTDTYVSGDASADTLFQIGSITKSFTAVIVLQLIAEKKLSINDTIGQISERYGPWLTQEQTSLWKDITIKQLLNMTSGIFDVVEDQDFMNEIAKNPKKSWSQQEVIQYAYQHKSYFQPGAGWHYSNTAYNILGLMIEKITKQTFKHEINRRILQPFALNHTYYLTNRYSEKLVARGISYSGGGYSPPIKSGTDMTQFNLSAAGPSGALISNTQDITRWVKLLFTGKILGEKQLTLMKAAVCMSTDQYCQAGMPLNKNSSNDGYSLGLAQMVHPKLGLIWFYVGSTPGYYSAFLWLPKSKTSLALCVSSTSPESKNILKRLVEIASLPDTKQ